MSNITALQDVSEQAVHSKAERTRARLLAAAARALKERGYGDTRLSDVAKIAKVQPAALYYHFDSREALIEEVVTLGQQRVHNHVAAELSKAGSDIDALERIRLAIRAHLEITLRDCDFASASIRTLGQLPKPIRDRQLIEQRRYGDLWRSLVLEGVASGQVKPNISASALRMLSLGALNWIPEWWSSQHGSLEEIVQAAQSFIVDAIRA